MRLRILAACIAGVAVLVAARGGWAGPSHRVALLPIVVHSAEEDAVYLSDGLADMIAARLERAGGISVIRIQSDTRSTTRPPVAVEEARRAGADYVVFGSFTQFGSGASLDVQCARVAEGEEEGGEPPRRIFIQSGAIGEIIPKLDELTEKIARYLSGGVPPATASGPESAEGDPGGLGEILRRLDALERTVYEDGVASPPAPAGEAAGGEETALEFRSSGRGGVLLR